MTTYHLIFKKIYDIIYTESEERKGTKKMFILGFVCAWTLGAFLAVVFDNIPHSGVCLFDGWGIVILLLPAYILIVPVKMVYRAVKKLHRKNS